MIESLRVASIPCLLARHVQYPPGRPGMAPGAPPALMRRAYQAQNIC